MKVVERMEDPMYVHDKINDSSDDYCLLFFSPPILTTEIGKVATV